MPGIVNRDWSRTEHDDYVLNVEPRLSPYSEAAPVIVDGAVVAWKIQARYE